MAATAAQLASEVRRVVEDMPYQVAEETPDGFTVHIDVVDAKWWTLMQRKSLKFAFKHIVRVDESAGTYTVTDQSVTVEWQAGAEISGGIPRPVLRGSVSGSRGTVRTLSFRKEYAVDDDGSYGKVVDYSFDSGEGNRVIDAAADRLGLTKKMNSTSKVGLAVALLAVGGLVVAGIVLGILALAGAL